MYYFTLSYDSTVRGITLSVILTVIAATILLRLFRAPLWALGGATLLNGLLLGLAWFYAPHAYRLEGHTLIVDRKAGPLRIPLQHAWVRLAHKQDLAALFRTFGNGGLFGYYGRFQSETLGQHEWYATNKNKLVVLHTSGKVYVLSPDQVDMFLDRINNLP